MEQSVKIFICGEIARNIIPVRYFKDAAKGADTAAAWTTPFIIAGIACLLGAVIILLIKTPKKA